MHVAKVADSNKVPLAVDRGCITTEHKHHCSRLEFPLMVTVGRDANMCLSAIFRASPERWGGFV